MKRYFNYALMALVITSFVLSSCDKESDEPTNDNDLVGTWEYKVVDDDGSLVESLIFNSDFTGVSYFCDNCVEEYGFSGSEIFTWSISDNKLFMLFAEDSYSVICSISGNHLVLTSSDGAFQIYLRK